MEILKEYLPLCFFKKKVYQVPRSISFFRKNLLFYVVLAYFIQANLLDDPIEAFFEVLLETTVTIFFISVMLLMIGGLHTFIQVTTVFLFCENFISFIGLPVVVWLTLTDDPFSYYLLFALLFWSICIIANVIRQVLNITRGAGMVMSITYFFITYVVVFFVMS